MPRRTCSPTTVHLLDVGLQASVNGQEELRASLEALLRVDPGSEHHSRVRIIGEGNLVAMEYELTGHHRGEMFGVEPTGKRISWSGFAMFEVDVTRRRSSRRPTTTTSSR